MRWRPRSCAQRVAATHARVARRHGSTQYGPRHSLLQHGEDGRRSLGSSVRRSPTSRPFRRQPRRSPRSCSASDPYRIGGSDTAECLVKRRPRRRLVRRFECHGRNVRSPSTSISGCRNPAIAPALTTGGMSFTTHPGSHTSPRHNPADHRTWGARVRPKPHAVIPVKISGRIATEGSAERQLCAICSVVGLLGSCGRRCRCERYRWAARCLAASKWPRIRSRRSAATRARM